MESKGLGDTIYKITKFTGIHPIVTKLIKKCNCEENREILNNKFPYKK